MSAANDIMSLPEGTDPEELLVPQDPNKRPFTKKWFEYNGKKWPVEIYKDLTVRELNEVMREMYVTDPETGATTRDNNRYVRALLLRFIKKAPFPIDAMTFEREKAIVADKIVRLLPYTPIQMMADEETKKKLSKL